MECRCSHAHAATKTPICEDMRGDVSLAMPEGMLVVDVNIVHALAVTYVQGAVATGKSVEVDSAAAAMGEHKNVEE